MRIQLLRSAGILAILAALTAGSGCASMNNTEKGALGGGVFGTAAGTVIGAATGRPLLGAAVGGAVGTAGGALIGNSVDKDERYQRDVTQAAAVAAAQAQQARLGISDVMGLAQAGHDDTVIINQIRSSGSTFDLTASDLDMLKRAGVSQRVIAEMQVSRPTPPRVIVREPRPVIYDTSPVYVQPAPPPVVIVGPPPRRYYGGGYYYRRW